MTANLGIEYYTKKVRVDRLKRGDILAHDIYLNNGTLVIKAGVELTDSQLEALKRIRGKIVTLDLSRVYAKSVAASKMLMQKAAEGIPVTENEVKAMIDPFIFEANREKNIVRLLLQLRSRDEYTFQHTINIGILAMVIARWLGYNKEDQAAVALAGALHDIGKSRIPLDILNKPGPLTPAEFEEIKKHTLLGYEILEKSGFPKEYVKITALQHHEREDGKGYPQGLPGSKIHPFAKVVAVADIYHAMTSERVYKKKFNPYYVLDYLQKNLSYLDPGVLIPFIDHMLQYLPSFQVVLNTSQLADVIRISKYDLGFPLVRVRDTGKLIDLSQNKEICIIDVRDTE